MRIPEYKLGRIRGEILDDLYKAAETKLTKRRIDIAKQNREHFLAPFNQLLDQVPVELLARSTEYTVRIKYTPKPESGSSESTGIDEKWTYKTEKAITNPLKFSSHGYSDPLENTLDIRLQDVTDKLCNDILTLRKEKEELSRFLHQTTGNNKGSKQLRKIWPESLHKYLPAEPVKIPKNKTTETKIDPAIPSSLNIRLTNNLLERS